MCIRDRFTVALTTTMAAGVLFWGPAEPIAHYMSPPTEIYGIDPKTPEALKFSMETMFLHWTIVPYAIYTVPAVVFAFMYYNAKKPFSISSEMAPLLGKMCIRDRNTTVEDNTPAANTALGEKPELRIYGKTGMGKANGVTVDAWFTGFADSAGQRMYFCVYLGETPGADVTSTKAREIAVDILSDEWQR